MLALGLASAVALAAAALLPFADPDASAAAEQARIASDAAEGIAAEWALALRDPALPVPDAPTAVVAHGASPVAARDAGAPSSPAAKLLLAESERQELARSNLPEALALAEEALAKEPDRDDKARGRLRAVQIAARLGRQDAVREHFARALEELDGTEVVDGTSALALALLAADSSLDDDARARACERVGALAGAGDLVLPGDGPRLVPGDGSFVVVEDPRREAFETLLQRVCGAVAAPLEPLSAALRSLAGDLVDTAPRDTWALRRVTDGILFARTDDETHVRLALASLESVERRLGDIASRRGLLASGVTVDVSGDKTELGPVLRPAVDLAPGALSFTLRHADPQSIATAARRRAGWSRAGTLALACFVALAAAFAHRALRRERRLADLRSLFVANVSHELRTPVASILLLAENLESGRAGPDATARYHTAIRGEALRLRRLVEDVLDFSRVERGRPIAIEREETDLTGWSSALQGDLQELATRHGLELHFRAPARDGGGTALHGSIDREALRRAAVNLLDNAAKHSGSTRVEVDIHADAGQLIVSVRDHGRGIAPARREEVFEPFARLEHENGVPGAGLGLAIVREIAQAHGGTARAVDPPTGAGAQLEMVIPLDTTGETP